MSEDFSAIDVVNQLLSDEKSVVPEKMTPEQVAELKKYLNPATGIPTVDKEYANITIVNMEERYMRKFVLTSAVGWLRRLASEYEPTPQLDRIREEFKKKMEGLPNDEQEILAKERDAKLKETTNIARKFLAQFFGRHLEYNPDFHVRSAGKSESMKKATAEAGEKNREDILKRCREESAFHGEVMESIQDNSQKFVQNAVNAIRFADATTSDALTAINSIMKVLTTPMDDDSRMGILSKLATSLKTAQSKLHALHQNTAKIVDPLTSQDIIHAVEKELPAEAFHQLNRYITNNYERLREMTDAIYADRANIENIVIFYGSHKTPEDARDFRIKNNDVFRYEVLTVETGGATLLGEFKQNRDQLDYYNKNTDIIKGMAEQVEMDQKLGEDMLKKAVRVGKQREIKELGLDAKGLAEYQRVVGRLDTLGAKKVLTKEDYEEMAKLNRIKDDLEVPQDAIQVDVLKPVEVDGEIRLERGKFYTKAEAPPVEDKKTITSRTGQKVRLTDLKKN